MQYPDQSVVVNQNPFDGTIGRAPRRGFWWMAVNKGIKDALQEKGVKFDGNKTSLLLSGFSGVVVDATLFRASGKSKDGDYRTRSNLAASYQRTLSVVEEKYDLTTKQRISKRLIGTSDNWKGELKELVKYGGYTKVVAMLVSRIVLDDKTPIEVDNLLIEVRLATKQQFYFNDWLSKEVNMKDTEIFGNVLFTDSKDDFKDQSGENSYGKFKTMQMPKEKEAKWEPIVVEAWEKVKKYIIDTSPGITPATQEEETIQYPEPAPVVNQPTPQVHADAPGDFPTVDDEPPASFDEDDDLPF
jgi:hypothetical protein